MDICTYTLRRWGEDQTVRLSTTLKSVSKGWPTTRRLAASAITCAPAVVPPTWALTLYKRNHFVDG
jgi:hypothetical protein